MKIFQILDMTVVKDSDHYTLIDKGKVVAQGTQQEIATHINTLLAA